VKPIKFYVFQWISIHHKKKKKKKCVPLILVVKDWLNKHTETLNDEHIQSSFNWFLKLSIKSMIRSLCDSLAQKVRNDYSLQTNENFREQTQQVGKRINDWWMHGHFLWSSILSILSFSHLQLLSHFPTLQFTSFHANLTPPPAT